MLILNDSKPAVDLFTNFVRVEEGKEVSFLCSLRVCNTPKDRWHCWWAEGTRLRSKPNYSVVKSTMDDNGNYTISKLRYNFTSAHNEDLIGSVQMFFCEDPNPHEPSHVMLPVCFNGTVSHAIVVQVVEQQTPHSGI